MKKIILLVLLISVTLLSCKKEPQQEYNGKITGYYLRLCACCGGNIIVIGNATYRFLSLPPNSGIDLKNDTGKYVIPIYVVVTWHKSDHPCKGDEIIIDAIRKK